MFSSSLSPIGGEVREPIAQVAVAEPVRPPGKKRRPSKSSHGSKKRKTKSKKAKGKRTKGKRAKGNKRRSSKKKKKRSSMLGRRRKAKKEKGQPAV